MEAGAHFFHHDFSGFQRRIDIGVIAVAAVCQTFHVIVPDVAGAEAENREIDSFVAFLFNEFFQFIRFGDSDVQIAVGGKEDAVVGAFAVILLRQLIGLLDAAFPVGAALRHKIVDCGGDGLFIAALYAVQDHFHSVCVGNNGDCIVLIQLIHQLQEGFLQKRKLVRLVHGA